MNGDNRAQDIVKSYEQRFNNGKPIFAWGPRQVAQLLGVTAETARGYLRDPGYLGYFAFGVGPDQVRRIERGNLIVALHCDFQRQQTACQI